MGKKSRMVHKNIKAPDKLKYTYAATELGLEITSKKSATVSHKSTYNKNRRNSLGHFSRASEPAVAPRKDMPSTPR